MNAIPKFTGLSVCIALGISVVSTQSFAWTGDIPQEGNIAYVKDSDGDIVRDSWGQCVRTIDWTKTLATAKCEDWPETATVVTPAPVTKTPAPVAEPKPEPIVETPAPAAVEPTPEPAPIVQAPTKTAIVVATPLAFSGFFETNGNALTDDAKSKLDDYVEYLNANPSKSVDVIGYTDDRGKASYNQQLSERRANSVKTYLESKGIASDRVRAIGMGESNPIADNKTAAGRAENRRVELEVK